MSRYKSSIVGLALLMASCSEPQFTTPTSATTTTTDTTTTVDATATTDATDLEFSGQLELGASRFYSFTITTARTVTVTLESLTGTGGQVAPRVALSLGVPSGSGCQATATVATGAEETPQFTESLAKGTYCARIDDIGALTAPALFTVRIVLP